MVLVECCLVGVAVICWFLGYDSGVYGSGLLTVVVVCRVACGCWVCMI